jgi:multicomponent Na+:H+ antiporter subunit C
MHAALRDTVMLGQVFYVGALGLVLLGIFAVTAVRHVVRVILGLTLLESGVNLFLVATGFRPDAVAPILVGQAPLAAMVDPIPQALILTAIVIGVGVQAVALALAIRVYRAYGTLDVRVLARDLASEEGGGAGEGGSAVPRRGRPVLPGEVW